MPEIWAGRRPISLRMWLALALSYDVDPLGYCARDDLRTLLPNAHRAWLGAWQPGAGAPRFRVPFGSDGEPSWTAAAQWLTAWIDQEDEDGRLRLVDGRVARHAVVQALAEAGLPVDLASDFPARQSPARLVYETEPTIDLGVHFIPDSPLIDRDELQRVIDDMYWLRYTAQGRAMVALLAARRSMQRLEALVPGCVTAVAMGDSVRLPTSVIARMSVRGGLSGELTLTTVGIHFAANGYFVVIYELHKDGA